MVRSGRCGCARVLRRSWTDYRKKLQQTEAEVADDETAETVTRDIAEALHRSASYRTSLRSVSEKLSKSIEQTQDIVNANTSSHSLSPPRVIQSLEQLRQVLSQRSAIVEDVENYLDELKSIEKKAVVVGEHIKTLRDQLDQVYEIIGLGMTAEALTHELGNIAMQLAGRTQRSGNIRVPMSRMRECSAMSST